MIDEAGRDRRRRIAFISSNLGWGGSEALWSETAAILRERMHQITVYKNHFPAGSGNVQLLKSSSCRLTSLAWFPFVPYSLFARLQALAPPISLAYQALRLGTCLALRKRPDLVVLSQGGNHDGWYLASVCRKLGLRYAIVSHKASDLHWPLDRWLPHIRAAYRDAHHVFFVSHANRLLTEEQLGFAVEHWSIVRNPFGVDWQYRPKWPDELLGLRLACVGRLHTREKGQDLLLRVLARPKWRQRAISVTFFGEGEQAASLREMSNLYRLTNVTFAGFERDVARIWSDHHGLVLPSRAEGLPLTVVEAMLSRRVPIVTAVAGNGEVVEDGKTGFVAAAPTEDSLDEVLERAWERRREWRSIADRAAESVRKVVPPDPAALFAEILLGMACEAMPARVETQFDEWDGSERILPQAVSSEAAYVIGHEAVT